jgi:hypothetical protein
VIADRKNLVRERQTFVPIQEIFHFSHATPLAHITCVNDHVALGQREFIVLSVRVGYEYNFHFF